MKNPGITISNFPIIHGIRVVCALIVAMAHAKFFFWIGGQEYLKAHPKANWNVGDYLKFGIDIATSNGTAMAVVFFLLSGFFIAYTLKQHKWGAIDFYKVRFTRIYIPFLGSVIYACLLFFMRHQSQIFFFPVMN